MGPPGTGKTFAISAWGKAAGINVLLLRPDQMRGKYVGESEAKWANCERGMRAYAPCLVIVDEADQKVRRGEGGGEGSQVENNLFGSMLEFFGDPKNKGQIVGAFLSNRPDLMDLALLSRCQVRLPVLPPDSDAKRADLLARILWRYGHSELKTDEPWLLQIAPTIDGWSGRDVDQAVDKTVEAEDLDGKPLPEAVAWALQTHRPQQRDVTAMTAAALSMVSDIDLLPPAYRPKLQDTDALEAEVNDLQTRERSRRSAQFN